MKLLRKIHVSKLVCEELNSMILMSTCCYDIVYSHAALVFTSKYMVIVNQGTNSQVILTANDNFFVGLL